MGQEKFMRLAIELSQKSIENGGGPFGAVIVKNGEIVASGSNSVTKHNDPTAHAEISAIRNACEKLNTFVLDDCEIYSSCEPCPMCLSAIYWARIKKVYFANTRDDAEDIGFSDSFIYNELNLDPEKRSILSQKLLRNEAQKVFKNWKNLDTKIEY